MAGSVNKVILVGNLGRDPEGAAPERRQGRQSARRDVRELEGQETGERKERTEWHSVVIFNENLANVAKRYLKKGSKVYLEGQLQTRKWQDQSGQDRYSTEVVLQGFNGNLTMLDGPAAAVAVQAQATTRIPAWAAADRRARSSVRSRRRSTATSTTTCPSRPGCRHRAA